MIQKLHRFINNIAYAIKMYVTNDDKTYGVEKPRSSKWPKVRADHLLKQSKCQACGETDNLQVHHIKPFHKFPELELDENNLITLCEGKTRNCHFTFGHFYDWHCYNPDVKKDAVMFNIKLTGSRHATY